MNIDGLYDAQDTEEQQEWWDREILNITTGTVEYRGGAGPSEEQTITNTMVLYKELKNLNIPDLTVGVDFDYARNLWGGDEPQVKLTKLNGEEAVVGYDRWGYCIDSEYEFEDSDQIDLETAINELTKWAIL